MRELIIKLENKYSQLLKDQKDNRLLKESELRFAYFELFDRHKHIIEHFTTKLEESTDYIGDEWDNWPCQIIDCRELLDYFESMFDSSTCSTYWGSLNEYIAENYCAHLSKEYDNLISNGGPAIIINDDGDVYDQDSGKWIVDKSDYSEEWLRDYLIEEYCETKGYYPGVFYQDRYGQLSLVNTRESRLNFKLRVLDCCYPDYFNGYSGEFDCIAIWVNNEVTISELYDAIEHDVNNCCYEPEFYAALDIAIKNSREENANQLDKIVFPDLEDCQCEDKDNCECNVYAYFAIERD